MLPLLPSEIDRIMVSERFASDPAFDALRIRIRDIPRYDHHHPLGLYFPQPEWYRGIGIVSGRTIIVPPEASSGTLYHELGHRYGHYYYNDLSEDFAEEFRKIYQPGVALLPSYNHQLFIPCVRRLRGQRRTERPGPGNPKVLYGYKPTARPPRLGPRKAVAFGTRTAITAIRAPLQASAGQQVTIEVDIYNIYMYVSGLYLAATAQDAGVSFSVSPGYTWVDASAKYTFLITFTMPNGNLRVNIFSWWWDGSKWVYDDTGYVDIILAAPALAGKIIEKWINKAPEGSRLPMPPAVKADGNTFEVGVSYRNDSAVNITGGVEVIVTKPDGYTRIAPAIDWAAMSPGRLLNKEYNISRVDQEGAWPIAIRFLAQT